MNILLSKLYQQLKYINISYDTPLTCDDIIDDIKLYQNKLAKIKDIDVDSIIDTLYNDNMTLSSSLNNIYDIKNIESIQEIYSSLLLKDHSILLHTVSKFKEYHIDLAEYIFDLFPQFTVLTYNGDGIRILTCRLINVKKVTSNNYGQLINKYHYSEGVHHFKNYSISEVLQIIKDHSHISIISGNLASRGISFVSSDYSIHLTDQYFVPGKKTHGESYLQSLRILGCYNDSKDLTLWCTERTWELIFQHNNFVYNLVKNINSEKDWLTKLQKIKILKPDTSLTRPKLTKGTKFNRVPHSNHFNFCIEYQEEPEEEIEEDI
jgi:hypothetical protein